MNRVDVSVVFVNYKTKDLTINAIRSVIEKTEGLEYEIFVVDNNSSDGSIEAIEQEFPNINIIKNSVNAGFGTANNLGIRQAHGKYILCLNTDTLLVNNAIKIMFDFMEQKENQNVGGCGGVLYDKDLNVIHSGGSLPSITAILWKFGLRYIFPEKYKKIVGENCLADKIEFITGADIFFRKSVLDEVGLFDENIFMYFEDSDLCLRIKNAKYEIKLIEDAKIIHLESQSVQIPMQKRKWYKTSEFYYFKKHYPQKYYFVKFLYIILYFIGGCLLNNEDDKELLNFCRSMK